MSQEIVPEPGIQISVVRGAPTDEELAAVSAVMLALTRERGNPYAPESAARVGGWKSYWHTVRHSFIPGREAWRSTFRR